MRSGADHFGYRRKAFAASRLVMSCRGCRLSVRVTDFTTESEALGCFKLRVIGAPVANLQ